MYLNFSTELLNAFVARLTLTLDVFKFYLSKRERTEKNRLTLTLDVFKYIKWFPVMFKSIWLTLTLDVFK